MTSRGRAFSSGVRLGVSVAAGILAGVSTALATLNVLAPVVGWDVTALVYAGWAWLTMLRLNARQTAELAVKEDPSRAFADLLLLAASVFSLAAVALVIAGSGSSSSPTKELRIALGVVSVVLSWVLVHTIFTSRYARLYYTGSDGGIAFKQEEPPRYRDFAYVAFTVGMTFQVSDTDITSGAMRSAVLRHALLSYLLGAVIIASTINLVAGLVK